MSMYAMAWVDQSGFSCKVAYTVTFWLIFVVLCYVIMELNMRKTDKKLKLVPRRTYLPPPVKRLFTREPPVCINQAIIRLNNLKKKIVKTNMILKSRILCIFFFPRDAYLD